MDVQSHWWEHFFHGVAVEMWIQAVPPEQTRQEAAAIERRLGLPAGAEVLDVPCGHGRLSLELAARGFRVTGVDLSTDALNHARAADADRLIIWEGRDMRDLPWASRFDGALCAGNSFGYLDDEGNLSFLRAVLGALKPGGRFVLETPMIVESLLPNLKDRPWFKAGDIHLLVTNEYDAANGRLNTEYVFVAGGRVEVRRGSHRMYTYRQLIELMKAAGFTVEPDAAWTRASPALTLVGTRR